ncbi:MAG TPA: hypothetical protein VFO29_11870 [Candidatus Rubrimentiphilum sp.]|nr:hypothetical protein [Candidatus Rubrimentiphilum sp.]
MKNLICTYGDKGGCGKSTEIRGLAESLIAADKNPLLVDADPTVGHLVGYLGVRDGDGYPVIPQPANGVRTYALHGSADDRVEFGAIVDSGRDLILVDLPAASATLLKAVEADYGLFAYAHERGYDVTLVCVLTPDGSSMLAVQDAADLDPRATIVAVKNLAFGDPKHFILWDGSPEENVPPATGKAIVAERGAEIVLPALDRGTLALIGLHRLTFREAVKSPYLIGPRQRQVARFLSECREQFESVGAPLGFAPAKRSAA